jgi:hypothetical protein
MSSGSVTLSFFLAKTVVLSVFRVADSCPKCQLGNFRVQNFRPKPAVRTVGTRHKKVSGAHGDTLTFASPWPAIPVAFGGFLFFRKKY